MLHLLVPDESDVRANKTSSEKGLPEMGYVYGVGAAFHTKCRGSGQPSSCVGCPSWYVPCGTVVTLRDICRPWRSADDRNVGRQI